MRNVLLVPVFTIAPEAGKDIHVGFLTTDSSVEGFTTVVLPASEYASFEVVVTNGYDGENENMNKWLNAKKILTSTRV